MEDKQITFFPHKRRDERVIKISIDKFLLGVIFLLLAGVAIFYTGIKTGEKRIKKKASSCLNNAITNNKEEKKPINQGQKIKVQRKEENISIPNKKEPFFTVQLATYAVKNEAIANKNIAILKKKGIKAFKIKKGNYIILCAGKFKNRHDAYKKFTTLKKDYHDCFIKEVEK